MSVMVTSLDNRNCQVVALPSLVKAGFSFVLQCWYFSIYNMILNPIFVDCIFNLLPYHISHASLLVVTPSKNK